MPALGGAAFRPKKNNILKANSNDDDNDDLPILDDATRKMIMQDIQRGRNPSFPAPHAPTTHTSNSNHHHQLPMSTAATTAALSKNDQDRDDDTPPPSSVVGAYGTGIQGASYLLQQKEKRDQELEAMMRQLRAKKQNNSNITAAGGEPSGSSLSSGRSAIDTLLQKLDDVGENPYTTDKVKKTTGTTMTAKNNNNQNRRTSQQPTTHKRLIVHSQPRDDEYVPELDEKQFQSKLLSKNGNKNKNNNDDEPTQPPTPASILDPGLIDVMATRLRHLEKQNGFLQSEVKEKSIKLATVQNKLSDSEEAVEKLQTERMILAEKLASMSRFLADYGLKWVGGEEKVHQQQQGKNGDNNTKPEVAKKFDLYAGNVSSKKIDSNDDSAASNQHDQGTGFEGTAASIEDEIAQAEKEGAKIIDIAHNNPMKYNNDRTPPKQKINTASDDVEDELHNRNQKPLQKTHHQSHFDFDKFVMMCQALSSKVSQNVFSGGQGGNNSRQPHSNSNNTVVSLRPREVIVVTVFADGITVSGGPFRPFGWALCDAFVQDVMDGYFPYEYRGKYPDGFPIDVVDKRGERYLVVPGGAGLMDPESLASNNNNSKNSAAFKNNNNNKNRIRTLQDSPYSLRKQYNNNNNNNNNNSNQGNNYNTNSSSSVLPSTKGQKLGGTKHIGAKAGAVATRDLILKRIPTKYVTASGRIINPAAGIAEFLNLPSDQLSSTFNTKKNNNNNNNNNSNEIIPQTPPRFSLMKDFKGPAKKVIVASDHVEKKLNLGEKNNSNNNNNTNNQAENNNNNGIRIRAVFPSSGDQVEINISDAMLGMNSDFTVQQLQEQILLVAAQQGILLRPPVDLTDHDASNIIGDDNDGDNNKGYEMEFVVRSKNEERSSTSTTLFTANNVDNDNNGMGSRQASAYLSKELFDCGNNNNSGGSSSSTRRRETIVVRWKKIN